MTDFLKAFPFVSMEEYLWKYSVPLIRVMSADTTHTLYLSESQAKEYERWLSDRRAIGYTDPEKLMNDLGLPVFKKKTN
jgi:hypothetical protein